MTEHDCPHCAEARAIAEQLRGLLAEGHALLAKLRRMMPDGHHIDTEPEPHPMQPPTGPHMRHA